MGFQNQTRHAHNVLVLSLYVKQSSLFKQTNLGSQHLLIRTREQKRWYVQKLINKIQSWQCNKSFAVYGPRIMEERSLKSTELLNPVILISSIVGFPNNAS